MWGAIIGDLAGSIYEYEQVKGVKSVFVDKLIVDDSFYSDDSILTIAVLDAILNNYSYEDAIKNYVMLYEFYKPKFKPYFNNIFSSRFREWANGNRLGDSIGNGALMRCSSIGYLFDTEEDVVVNTYKATACSHNSKEAITCSQVLNTIILLARHGLSKEEIFMFLGIDVEYNPFKKFNVTCKDTLNNCLYAIKVTDNFSDAIRKVISFGGDTDTNAAIVGSMAEAMYGLDQELVVLAKEKIPNDFVKKLELGYKKMNRN